MSSKNKVNRLLEQARELRGARRWTATARPCRGRPLADIGAEVEAACPPECLPLLIEVIERMVAFEEAQHAAEEQTGKRDMYHGFLRWLLLLQEGAASLPETLPESVVRAWHRGQTFRPGNPSAEFRDCIPWTRCDDCLFVVPDGDRKWTACPVCKGARICWPFLGEFGVYYHFDRSKGLDRSGRLAR